MKRVQIQCYPFVFGNNGDLVGGNIEEIEIIYTNYHIKNYSSSPYTYVYKNINIKKQYKNILVLNVHSTPNEVAHDYLSMEILKTQGNIEEIKNESKKIGLALGLGYILYGNVSEGEVLDFSVKTTVGYPTNSIYSTQIFIIFGFN